MKKSFFIYFLFFCTFPSCRISTKSDPPRARLFLDGHSGKGPALAVIGDSLSTGVLASTLLGGDFEKNALLRLIGLTFSGNHALESLQANFSELENSATATDKEWGLREAIGREFNIHAQDIPLYFAAKWGGRSTDIPDYLKHLEGIYKARGKIAEYVVLMLGGNDFCYGRSPEEFQKLIEKNFEKIVKVHPHSTIIVALDPVFPEILRYNFEYSPSLSCEKFRMKYCKKVFDEARHDFPAGYNEGLMRVVNYYRHVYPGKILLSSEFESMYIEKDDLSFDCFHVSLKGQRKFASYLEHTMMRQEY